KTWVSGVLPQMAPRLGLPAGSLYEETSRNPYVTVLSRPVSQTDWQAIVRFYEERAPVVLSEQSLPAEPQLDPPFFTTGPFIPGLQSSAIITLLKADSVNDRIFVGEAVSNTLRIFDFDGDGRPEYVICEFGNNRGRLALYRAGATGGSRYQRQVLDASPGAIRFEIRDMTGDGAPDIVALFAQADERIVLFENDGAGRFGGRQRAWARFPPLYGPMYFTLADFNGDGKPDILYVNGDNFDYSRVLKP